MGKYLIFDDSIGPFRVLCWEDDYEPFDFCFFLDGNRIAGYVDVKQGMFLDRLPYLKRDVEIGEVRVGRLIYDDYKGGVVAYDGDHPSAEHWVLRVAGYMHLDERALPYVFGDDTGLDLEYASAGRRVWIRGKAINTGWLGAELGLVLAGMAFERWKDGKFLVWDGRKLREVRHVFIADVLTDIRADDKYVVLRFEGGATEFELGIPRSWYRVRFSPSFELIDVADDGLVTLRRLTKDYFLRDGVFVFDLATGAWFPAFDELRL